MHKEFIGEIAPLVIYDGVLLPNRIRVVLSDTKATPGRRTPSVVLTFEIREERAKCISVVVTSGDDNLSISSAQLARIKIDELWLEAAQTLALQYRAADVNEVVPAERKRGRAAAKKLSDNTRQLSKTELMLIGFYYSNPMNQKSPTKAVQLGMGYGSRHTAIRRIKEARETGWVLPQGASDKEIKKHFEKVQKKVNESR